MATGGAFLRAPVQPDVPRWIWGGTSVLLLAAALAGWLLARQLRGETAAEAERVRASESAPVTVAN